MARLIILGMILGSVYGLPAQSFTAKRDSLKKLLILERRDTAATLIWVQLSKTYLEYRPDSALQFANHGLVLARRKGYAKGEVLCLKAAGAAYGQSGNYTKGLETLLRALKLSESINDKEGAMLCMVTIGVNYSHQEDYRQGLSYFSKAKSIADAIANKRYQLITLLNLGDAHEKLNQLDSASFFTHQCYELAIRFNIKLFNGFILTNLGNIHAKMKQDATAMGYYRRSLVELESTKNSDVLCESTLGMAGVFKRLQQKDSVLSYARQSLVLAKRSGLTQRLLAASNFLASFYEGLSHLDSAYIYQKIAIATKDSLYSQEKVRELQNLSFAERIRQQEIQDAAIEAAETKERNIQMAAIGAFIPLFFGFVLLFSRANIKPQTIDFLGMLALLLLFEFITLYLGTYISEWTHDSPILTLLTFVTIASILVPLHNKMELFVKDKLHHSKISS